MGGGFYPHGKPGWYAYTTRFTEVGHDSAGAAYAHTRYPGLGEKDGAEAVIDKALANLEALIAGARAAEMAFLADTGINLADEASAGDVFRNMNLILNSKDTFERGLRFMKNIADAGEDMQKEQIYREVTRNFMTYLNQAIKKELNGSLGKKNLLTITKDELEEHINRVISNALITSYKKVKDFIGPNGEIRGKLGRQKARTGETEVQAVQDMIDVIKKLKNAKAFKGLGHLFDLNREDLIERQNNLQIGLKKSRFNDAHADSRYGGNALEVVTSIITPALANLNINATSADGVLSLHSKGIHTGMDNSMKADSLLLFGYGEINAPDYLDFVDKEKFGNRVRMQNVDALSQYLNALEDNIKHVVAISDKNYSIKAGFSGVAAQERMNLQNAGLLLSQFGVGNVGKLINYLANCGAGMVQGDVAGEVRTSLQSYIAYFLFDHLEISVQGSMPSVNVVNVLNVSGLYIPLSVYLEGIRDSIRNALGSPSSLVGVTISLGGPTSAPTQWTAGIWGEFREEHETQSYIEYRILRDIAGFISSL